MAKRIKKVAMKTPIKSPLNPPHAASPVRTMKGPQAIGSSLSRLIHGSVSPPSQPNISLPPSWLGAFRRV